MSALTDTPKTLALWPAVWKLLRLRIVILLSGLRRAKLRRKIGMGVLGLLILSFLGFIFFLSWALLHFLRSPELGQVVENVPVFLDAIPSLILGGAFLGILVTSFGVLLQALYLAGDMDFLLTTPVPIRAVFISKLLQAILPNFSLIVLFALPVLFGLGAANGYNLLYYPMVLILLAAMALAAAGLSSLLVMLVARIFPPRRVAEVLGFVVGISSFICSQTGQFARFDNISQSQVAQAAGTLTRLNSPWSPFAWIGRSLVDLGTGRWLSAGFFLFLSLGAAALLFGVALTTAERLYYTGWASVQTKHGKKKKTSRLKPASAGSAETISAGEASQTNERVRRLVPAPIRAIMVKDFYMLRRDLRNMSQLITPLILGLVYAGMLMRDRSAFSGGLENVPPAASQAFQNIPLYGGVGISLFVSWLLLARLTWMSFSQEGRSYWVLKSSPVKVWQLLAAKYMVAFLPAFLLSSLFLLMVTIIQGSATASLAFTLPVVVLTTAGNTGLNLAFGVVGAKMDWDDPRHMMRGTTGCVSMIASVIYLPVNLALFFGPTLVFTALRWPVAVGDIIGFVLGGGVALLCAVVPVMMVQNRVPRLGEDAA